MQLAERQSLPTPVDPARWLTDHGDILWRYAIARVRNADAAEELVQAALLAALESRAAFRGESTERTWLLGILRHKLADHARARHREYGAASSGNASVETHARDSRYDEHGSWLNRPARWSKNVNRSLESEEIWRDFENCLSRLPAGIAEAFVLREVRGISATSACVELRITPDNLWVRMHRARELLRKCLNSRWAVQKSRNPAVSLGGRPNDPRDRTELRGPAPTGSPVPGGAP